MIKNNKKIFILIAIIIIVTTLGVILAMSKILMQSNDTNTTTEESSQTTDTNQKKADNFQEGTLNITNLDSVSPDSNPDVKKEAQKILYRYATNLKSDSTSIDAIVRDGSFSRKETSHDTYTDSMIIDISSLKQSWGLKFTWSNSKGIIGDHIFPMCLPEDKLIYGSFACSSNYGEYN